MKEKRGEVEWEENRVKLGGYCRSATLGWAKRNTTPIPVSYSESRARLGLREKQIVDWVVEFLEICGDACSWPEEKSVLSQRSCEPLKWNSRCVACGLTRCSIPPWSFISRIWTKPHDESFCCRNTVLSATGRGHGAELLLPPEVDYLTIMAQSQVFNFF